VGNVAAAGPSTGPTCCGVEEQNTPAPKWWPGCFCFPALVSDSAVGQRPRGLRRPQDGEGQLDAVGRAEVGLDEHLDPGHRLAARMVIDEHISTTNKFAVMMRGHWSFSQPVTLAAADWRALFNNTAAVVPASNRELASSCLSRAICPIVAAKLGGR
jgi:hypothetical protein